jgi:hypothetical protein
MIGFSFAGRACYQTTSICCDLPVTPWPFQYWLSGVPDCDPHGLSLCPPGSKE